MTATELQALIAAGHTTRTLPCRAVNAPQDHPKYRQTAEECLKPHGGKLHEKTTIQRTEAPQAAG